MSTKNEFKLTVITERFFTAQELAQYTGQMMGMLKWEIDNDKLLSGHGQTVFSNNKQIVRMRCKKL